VYQILKAKESMGKNKKKDKTLPPKPNYALNRPYSHSLSARTPHDLFGARNKGFLVFLSLGW
jgi:hypothetical protein